MTVLDTSWWIENGPAYARSFKGGPAYDAQEAAVRTILAGLEFGTAIEVGAGFGRITRHIRETHPHAAILATDVSPMMDGVTHFDLNAPSDVTPADLVVAAEVLMHRTPYEVVRDVAILCRMAERYVLTVDWHEPRGREAEGCWQHDYRALFAPYGLVVEETLVPEARQAVYLVKRPRLWGITDAGREELARMIREDTDNGQAR